MIRKTIHYSGNVQGVGFRFTTQQAASKFHVAGYVRNLPDGRVELVAEGERDEVNAFADAVAERMGGYFSDTRVSEDSATDEFAGFDVRH